MSSFHVHRCLRMVTGAILDFLADYADLFGFIHLWYGQFLSLRDYSSGALCFTHVCTSLRLSVRTNFHQGFSQKLLKRMTWNLVGVVWYDVPYILSDFQTCRTPTSCCRRGGIRAPSTHFFYFTTDPLFELLSSLCVRRRLSSVVRRPSSVNFFKNLLLWNYCMDWAETLHACTLVYWL